MAGHSKWKQIKHKKAAADAARSRVFSKKEDAQKLDSVLEALDDHDVQEIYKNAA